VLQKINLLTRIKSLYPGMASAEQRVADYILGNPEEIYKLKIQDLAGKAGVSLPSVFRFSRRLGFSGYKDFKIELVKDIGVSFHISPDGMEEESVEGVTRVVFEKEIANLRETLASIDYAAVRSAVDAVAAGKRILFFAVSSSLPVALDFYWKFTLAGYTCFYNADTYTQRIVSTQCRKGDVAVGISFSGESAEVVDCVRNARGNGARTLCVTTFIRSSITRHADIALFTAPVRSLYQKVDLPSKISLTAILDVLYLLVLLRSREKSARIISKSEEELLKSRKR
jgi:DNA-binding MurR/RpiR family transcriptional regulator